MPLESPSCACSGVLPKMALVPRRKNAFSLPPSHTDPMPFPLCVLLCWYSYCTDGPSHLPISCSFLPFPLSSKLFITERHCRFPEVPSPSSVAHPFTVIRSQFWQLDKSQHSTGTTQGVISLIAGRRDKRLLAYQSTAGLQVSQVPVTHFRVHAGILAPLTCPHPELLQLMGFPP